MLEFVHKQDATGLRAIDKSVDSEGLYRRSPLLLNDWPNLLQLDLVDDFNR